MSERERWRPAVTVAAIVEHGGRYLLVEESTASGLMLNNPAGHLERGESPQQAVVREVLEETARGFVPEALVGVYLSRARDPVRGRDSTYLRLAFTGRAGLADPARALDAGIVRTLWLTRDEVRAERARHRSPLLQRCVDDHAAGRRFALDLIGVEESVYDRAPNLECSMTSTPQPTIAQKGPYAVAVEAGKDYFWCACGNSKNQPFCDGSHKVTPFTPIKYTATKSETVWFCGCKRSGNKPLCDGTHKTL